ncbi:MAG TPA: metallophosphoesterase, partial [Ramlibacter sp.]
HAGVRVLDGEAVELEGIGFAGAKGFAGGFGRGSLGSWGEPAIKVFVKEALNEAMKLESALAKLRTARRVALLHYSPIAGTVQGEPAEIFPFLGSSRLEEPLLRYPVDAVFHGHAHRGTPEARTINGVPVFNVARPLLLRTHPEQPPFRLFELPRDGA